jgi:D-alanyl-lipoteichoic acid acyltransferase DltB (MBOAT superfamily)
VLFISDEFFLFLLLVLGTMGVVRHPEWRRWLLLGFCVWFYASWSIGFLGLLFANILIDYVIAIRLGTEQRPGARRALVTASIVMNLGMLGFFKYLGFGATALNEGMTLLGLGVQVPVPHLILPLGISFYVFQAISYTVDVYKGLLTPTRSLRELATFIMFFPHLVSGPIVRAAEILPQLERLKEPLRGEEIMAGAKDFVLGFGRKVVFADTFAALADATFAAPGAYGSGDLAIGLLAYSFQIYFDFSGYSQMAVGLARMFGIHFPDNFDAPYISRSLQEFWRRWHISLSRFLRDYLYIPLGGSRHGLPRTLFALSATMLIGGFWHGANWTFLVWGAIHGFGQALAYLYRERLQTPAQTRFWASPVGNFAGWALTMTTVALAWVFFRAVTVHDAWAYLARMLSGASGESALVLTTKDLGLFAAAVVIHLLAYFRPSLTVPWPRLAFAQGVVAAAAYVAFVALKQADAPFIYFNF